MSKRSGTVMVIDDDRSIHLLAREVFSGVEFKVNVCQGGQEALDTIRDVDPDVILLDIMMPGIDGFETCQRIKSIPEYQNTPIIMLTGMEDVEAVEKAYALGAWDFTSKPINWAILVNRVRYALRAFKAFEGERRAGQLSRTLDNSSNEIFMFNPVTMEILTANKSGRLNLGYDQKGLIRLSFLDLIETSLRDDFKNQVESMAGNHQLEISTELLRSDGTVYPVEGSLLVAVDESPLAHIAIFQDVTERKKSEAELYRLAFYDELTGLPNRRLFEEMVYRSLELAKRRKSFCSVSILDLDGFKLINDSFGHATGDELLIQISERLQNTVRGYDSVSRWEQSSDDASYVELARFGGDEFLLLLTDFHELSMIDGISQRILDDVSKPYKIQGHEIILTGSLGVSVFPNDGDSIDLLLKKADASMYQAKKRGKNTYTIHNTSEPSMAIERLQLESQLRQAVVNDELELYYQPQTSSETGELLGVEALIRWNHPEQGLLAPGRFMYIAEESSLCVTIGDWVIDRAVTDSCEWLGDLLSENSKVSINVETMQLQDGSFLGHMEQAVKRMPDGISLVVEMTESAIMSDSGNHVDALSALKKMGVLVAIDDFGTGYSSLSYLKRFPIDFLKIDKTFVDNVHQDSEDEAIVEVIFSLAQILGLEVVAEGVETEDQASTLRKQGFYLIQGYLVSPPLARKDFTEFTNELSQVMHAH